jgi:hypothetical protein
MTDDESRLSARSTRRAAGFIPALSGSTFSNPYQLQHSTDAKSDICDSLSCLSRLSWFPIENHERLEKHESEQPKKGSTDYLARLSA